MSHSSSAGVSNRGWNDPPKLQSNSDSQSYSRKQFTQRVTHILPERSKPVKDDVLPLSAPRPMLAENFAPPPTSCRIDKSVKKDVSSRTIPAVEKRADTEGEDIIPTGEEVLSRLQATLDECKATLRPRVIDDMNKKFGILEKAWSSGKLSSEVQLEMSKLSSALSERRYPVADKIHLYLMMEHISQVSSWMVGIKRLISEAKTILPSETNSSSDQSTQDSDQPKQQIPLLMPVNS